MLTAVLPKPPRIAFRNPKTLHDKLVCSKLKLTDDAELGNFPCRRGSCAIFNILKPGKEFKSTVTRETYKMNFHFDCNSLCVVYLITCKVCNSALAQKSQISERVSINRSET